MFGNNYVDKKILFSIGCIALFGNTMPTSVGVGETLFYKASFRGIHAAKRKP